MKNATRKHPSKRAHIARAWPLLLALMAFDMGPAQAQQALERHPPPVPPEQPAEVKVTPPHAGPASMAPLGGNLMGIHLIGQNEQLASQPPNGVSGEPVALGSKKVDAALDPFLGKPLSMALVRDIQVEIAKLYRQAGRPFVSVTLPPQEITSGIVQIRIIEFRLGTTSVQGVPPAEAQRIQRDLALTPGATINAPALDENLDWINRSPFLSAMAVFRPGAQPGQSDLEVDIAQHKPWQVYGGWTNSGATSTGNDRYFIGGSALIKPLNWATLSYQATFSPDVWHDPDQILPSAGDYPRYLSHAARLVIPTYARQDLEISPTYVATRENADTNTAFENSTVEIPVIYRSAVSNVLHGHYWGDLYGGAEFKMLHRRTYFDNVDVAQGNADLFQLVLGWDNTFPDSYGMSWVDARIKANPGGVLSGNQNTTWSTFTNGRVDDVHYAYGAIDAGRITKLPLHLTWTSQLSGVWAGHPMPDTERLSLGGWTAVRGYEYDDVSVDSGLILRNAIHVGNLLPHQQMMGRLASLSPFAFFDVGTGKDHFTKDSSTLASVGPGLEYALSRRFAGTAILACPLKDAGVTRAHHCSFLASLTGEF